MKVAVNEDCILCGVCEDICPEIFALGDEFAFVKKKVIGEEDEECCIEAAEQCPSDAIEIEE